MTHNDPTPATPPAVALRDAIRSWAGTEGVRGDGE